MKRLAILLTLLPLVALADIVDPIAEMEEFFYHGIFRPLCLSLCLTAVVVLLVVVLLRLKKKRLSAVLVIGVATFLLSFPFVKCKTCEGQGFNCGRIYCPCCDKYGFNSIFRGMFPCKSTSCLELPIEKVRLKEDAIEKLRVAPDEKSWTTSDDPKRTLGF